MKLFSKIRGENAFFERFQTALIVLLVRPWWESL